MTRLEAKRRVEAMLGAGTIRRGQQFTALDAILAGRDPVRACAPPVAVRAAVGTADAAFERYLAELLPGRRVTAQAARGSDAQALTAACRATPAGRFG